MREKCVEVRRAMGMRGVLRVPGDKSISHRVAMLGALAGGESVVRGFLRSEDCLNTLRAMEALGAGVVHDADGTIRIRGTAGRLRSPEHPLDMGNSGTGIRLLAGLLAGFPVVAELTGDASLCSRPMSRIQKPLLAMGADVELLGAGGCAPVRIRGGQLHPLDYTLPMASAQVKSAVLLAGLSVHGETRVREPAKTRDHTERILQALGVPLVVDGLDMRLGGHDWRVTDLPPRDWTVPGDFSSSAFWLTAGAMMPGSEITLEGVGLNPRRTALLDVLVRMGADIEIFPDEGSGDWEPTGTLVVRGGGLHGTEVRGEEIPNLIDELPLVAVAGAVAEGETLVADAAELRVKESDRIRSICSNLGQMGCRVEERADGFLVQGGPVVGGVSLPSYGDHRIVMALAVLALRAEEPVILKDTACVATSYPAFWQDLEQLCGAVVGCGGRNGTSDSD